MTSNVEPTPRGGDSYCGIWCGACSVRVFGESGRADPFIECFRGVPKTALVCSGCKHERPYAGCRECKIRDCAKAEGVEHCRECGKYPCKVWSTWSSGKRLVPHVGDSRQNLESIHQRGVSAWNAAQSKRWSCSECASPHSWYAQTCGNCGHDLSGNSHRLNVLRRAICRLLFPMLYRRAEAKTPAAP